MRRYWVVALAVLTFLGMLSPPAVAQAPAPKVTITGLLDTVTSAHWNLSQIDIDFTRARDTMWVSRQRGVFFFTGEVDKAKAVLGFEIDLTFGMTDTGATQGALAGANQLAFSTGTGSGKSVDVVHPLEVKHLYVEFPVPLTPWATTARLGGQPGAGTVSYKPTIFFDDFTGMYLVTTATPAVKVHLVVATDDEDATGRPKNIHNTGGAASGIRNTFTPFSRGDDITWAVGLDVTPIKELQVRPFVVHAETKGVPTNSQNTPAGGIAGFTQATLFASNQGKRDWYYLGLDARWRSGPWYFDPTFVYLYGINDISNSAVIATSTSGSSIGTSSLGGPGGGVVQQDVRSWLLDVRGGYRIGPLHLEAFFMYTPGNDARDLIGKNGEPFTQKFFKPVNTGGAYGATWSNFFANQEVDYIRGPYLGSLALNGGTEIGYDRYGRMTVSLGPSYAVTPALTLKGLVASHWTDEDVDTHGVITGTAANGLIPETSGNVNGDDNYLGTEFALGLTWRFAPGLTFDTHAAHLFAGDALRQCKGNLVGGACSQGGARRDARDATSVAARVRFTF